MSADFWAGYLSGAAGIVVGNPLDIVKVRLQATGPSKRHNAVPISLQFRNPTAWAAGTATPILGYGALNALLFVSYNRAESALIRGSSSSEKPLWATWSAGAVGGLATWVISTPTELIKCRAQASTDRQSSWAVAQRAWRASGLSGLYLGGVVTALRDSIGYGFYFWSYELSTRHWAGSATMAPYEAARVLLCGGLAGIVTWASVFPLDVLKTRVQTQAEGRPRRGALQLARQIHAGEGASAFFRGLGVCSARAFVVNAVQWTIYEATIRELGGVYKSSELTDAEEL